MSFEAPREDTFQGLDLLALDLDQAYVNISVVEPEGLVYLYRRSEDCDRCSYQLQHRIIPDSPSIQAVVTHYPWHYRFRSDGADRFIPHAGDDEFELCSKTVNAGQYGVYNLVLNQGDQSSCVLTEELEPINGDLSLLYVFLTMLGLGLVFQLAIYLSKRGTLDKSKDLWWDMQKKLAFGPKDPYEALESNAEAKAKSLATAKKRVKSLDVFRGIAIALMIFVNDGAGGYYYMEHATWNGLFVADLAFPWFMWIMGFCIPMGVRSAMKRNTPLGTHLWTIFKRSVKLFLLGFFWGSRTGGINLETCRIPGVLQRFCISYFVVTTTAALAARVCSRNKNAFDEKLTGWRYHLSDITIHWPRWVVAFCLGLTHTMLTFYLPVPGCPTGYLGPAGIHLDSAYPSICIGGATGYVDRKVLGLAHLYQYPTAATTYLSGAFDPEGILGSLNVCIQVFLGYQAGQIVMSHRGHWQRMIRYFSWAVITGLIGLGLCGASLNEGWIPINKNLWSLSYVFATSGTAFALIGIVYFLVDYKGWWGGGPFVYAGMNSITLYLGHTLAYMMLPFHYVVGAMDTHWERLVEALWGTGLWMVIAYILVRKKVFITV